MSLLPPQVNQGYLTHYNIIINEEHYIYVGDIHLRYVLFVEHVMLPIIMRHHMVKQISYIYKIICRTLHI